MTLVTSVHTHGFFIFYFFMKDISVTPNYFEVKFSVRVLTFVLEGSMPRNVYLLLSIDFMTKNG